MTITLADLRTQSRQRSDMENSKFVSDTELTSYINSSIAELHDIMIQSYGNDYFVIPFTFNTTIGQSTYALPDGFYKLHGVDVKLNGQNFTTVKKFNFNERNRFNETVLWNVLGIPSIRYRIIGNNIVFSPIPDTDVEVQLWYTPVATKLVADADVLDDLNQYAEYVITDAAIKMMQKEESDVTVLAAQKTALLQRITYASQNRDAGEPESVQDVYNENEELAYRS